MSLDVYFRDDILSILQAIYMANPQYAKALTCVAVAFQMRPEAILVQLSPEEPQVLVAGVLQDGTPR